MISVLLAIPFSAQAIRVPGLYEAEVSVAAQDDSSRLEATRQAMRLVLVKLTGDRNAGGRMALEPVIRGADKYVQQYRYLETAVEMTDPSSDRSLLTLRIQFDEARLNSALRGLGIQIWGRERPSILVWVAMEQMNIREILKPEAHPEYVSAMYDTAKARGAVLMFPLFDLEDTTALRASDIWGGFKGPVLSASARYFPDTILSGRIESPLPGIWEGRWTLYIKDSVYNWSTEASYPEGVLAEGIDHVVDRLAAQFVQDSQLAESAETELRVIDVFTLDHYARVLDYLGSLSPVIRTHVAEVIPGTVVLRITAYGGDRSLFQAINLGRTLEAVDERSNTYRLLP